MMMVEAIIKPFKLEAVRGSLFKMGVSSVIVTEIQGFARQRGHGTRYGGPEYRTDFVPKIKIQVTATEPMLPVIVDQILKSAHTGEIGDGKIFIHRLERVLPIQPGSTEEAGP